MSFTEVRQRKPGEITRYLFLKQFFILLIAGGAFRARGATFMYTLGIIIILWGLCSRIWLSYCTLVTIRPECHRAMIKQQIVRNAQYGKEEHHYAKVFQQLVVEHNTCPVFLEVRLSPPLATVRATDARFAQGMLLECGLISLNIVVDFSRMIYMAHIVHSFMAQSVRGILSKFAASVVTVVIEDNILWRVRMLCHKCLSLICLNFVRLRVHVGLQG